MKRRGSGAILNAFLKYVEGDFKSAIDIYRRLLDKKPNNLTLARNLALLLVLDKKYEEALMVIDKYLAMLKTEKKGKIRNKELYRELILLKITAQVKLNKLEGVYNLIESYLGEEIYICPIELEEALNFDLDLEDVIIELDEDDWLKIQRWLHGVKKDDIIAPLPRQLKINIIKCLYYLLEHTDDDVKKSEILSLISMLVTSLGKVKLGIKLAKESLELNPDGFKSNLIMGKINYLLGNLNTAYEYFLKAHKIASKTKERYSYLALLNIGIILSQAGLYKDALKFVNKAIKMNLSSRNSWYVRAKILLDSEMWKEAEKAFTALIQMDSKNPKIWIGLGKVYLNNGNLTKAVEAFLTAKKLIGNSEELNFLINLARNL